MLRFGALAMIAALSVGQVGAANLYEGAYFCVEEFGGGIHWDANAQRWESATFRPAGKFILKLEYKGDVDRYGDTVGDYDVTVTEAGDASHSPCRDDQSQAVVNVFDYLSCTAAITDYVFNLNKLRYTAAYQVGYVGGQDNNDNTPSMMGGTCTKID